MVKVNPFGACGCLAENTTPRWQSVGDSISKRKNKKTGLNTKESGQLCSQRYWWNMLACIWMPQSELPCQGGQTWSISIHNPGPSDLYKTWWSTWFLRGKGKWNHPAGNNWGLSWIPENSQHRVWTRGNPWALRQLCATPYSSWDCQAAEGIWRRV